ncbi:hypothetical protein [Streptomyces sp. STR69]|uniref:hypothetical protein n=1 Tax=Streptomyces sp. STR69 TaxID=1796942 RepID=UPI0029057E3D|nr:hypothetical protein [Streptomyces sp. STR69]
MTRTHAGTRTRTRRRAATATGILALLILGATACGTASAGDDKHPDHRAFALPGRALTIDSDETRLVEFPFDILPLLQEGIPTHVG